MRNDNKRKTFKLYPLLLLAAGLAIFYDFNPLYPFLLRVGINAHHPIVEVVDESWDKRTKPEILSKEVIGTAQGDKGIVALHTRRGIVNLKPYMAANSQVGVVFVPGAIGGFDSPAKGLYGRLGAVLPTQGVSAVHLSYRQPFELPEAVHDVRAAVQFLKQNGCSKVILIGHSMGGASTISAASFEPDVTALAILCSQPCGANRVHLLKSRLLVVSGWFDFVEPPCWSSAIYKEAVSQKQSELTLYQLPVQLLAHCLQLTADGGKLSRSLFSLLRSCELARC